MGFEWPNDPTWAMALGQKTLAESKVAQPYILSFWSVSVHGMRMSSIVATPFSLCVD